MNGRPLSSASAGPSAAPRRLRWALGGRSASKLAAVKAELELNPQLVEEPAVVIADSDDQQSLQRMTAQARVVITTVGPFATLGQFRAAITWNCGLGRASACFKCLTRGA